MVHCAGIIPFDSKSKKLLLGKTFRGEWSSFSGKSVANENYENTALREFREETAGIFNDSYVKKHMLPFHFISNTPKGLTIVIYFLPLLESQEHSSLFNALKSFQSYNEMKKVAWISMHILKENKIRLRMAFKNDIIPILNFLEDFQF